MSVWWLKTSPLYGLKGDLGGEVGGLVEVAIAIDFACGLRFVFNFQMF